MLEIIEGINKEIKKQGDQFSEEMNIFRKLVGIDEIFNIDSENLKEVLDSMEKVVLIGRALEKNLDKRDTLIDLAYEKVFKKVISGILDQLDKRQEVNAIYDVATDISEIYEGGYAKREDIYGIQEDFAFLVIEGGQRIEFSDEIREEIKNVLSNLSFKDLYYKKEFGVVEYHYRVLKKPRVNLYLEASPCRGERWVRYGLYERVNQFLEYEGE